MQHPCNCGKKYAGQEGGGTAGSSNVIERKDGGNIQVGNGRTLVA